MKNTFTYSFTEIFIFKEAGEFLVITFLKLFNSSLDDILPNVHIEDKNYYGKNCN